MITLHVPSRTFHSREFWWCDGLLHKHRSLVKAQECEYRRTPEPSELPTEEVTE